MALSLLLFYRLGSGDKQVEGPREVWGGEGLRRGAGEAWRQAAGPDTECSLQLHGAQLRRVLLIPPIFLAPQ